MTYITTDSAAHQSREQRRQNGYTVMICDAYDMREQLKADEFTFLPREKAWARFAATWADVLRFAKQYDVPFRGMNLHDEPLVFGAAMAGTREEHRTQEVVDELPGVTVTDDNGNTVQIDAAMIERVAARQGSWLKQFIA